MTITTLRIPIRRLVPSGLAEIARAPLSSRASRNAGFGSRAADGTRSVNFDNPVFDLTLLRQETGREDLAPEDLSPLLSVATKAPYLRVNPLFDADVYLRGLPSDVRALARRNGHPILHFLQNWHENRLQFSRYFDVQFYLRQEGVSLAPRQTPLEHYLSRPLLQRADANPMFHARYYSVRYGINDGDPLSDFVMKGHQSGRSANPWALDEIARSGRVTPQQLLAYIEV